MPPHTNEAQPQAFTPYGEVPKPEGVQESVTAPPPQANPGDDVYSRPGWSWGAFMFGPFFLVAIRKYWYLLLNLLPIVLLFGTSLLWVVIVLPQAFSGASSGGPLLVLAPIMIAIGFLSFLAVPIYFGIKGRVLASQSRTFANRDQYIGFMKVIDHAGKVAFFITVACIGVALLIMATLLAVPPKSPSPSMSTYPVWPSSIRE